MSPYGCLRQAVYREEVAAAPEMIAYAAREATYAGATIVVPNPTPPQAVVIDAVDQSRLGKQRFRELFTPKQGPVSPWVNGMFKVVDQNVRSGTCRAAPQSRLLMTWCTKRLAVASKA